MADWEEQHSTFGKPFRAAMIRAASSIKFEGQLAAPRA
jgi:hypothetical protein